MALLWVHPGLNTPAYLGGYSEEQGPVWPMLFVLVACGAVSGFHSLVAGGTVSKQLTNETQGRLISYGGMLTEGVVAVCTVLLVGGGLYWVAPAAGGIDMNSLGFRETLKAGWMDSRVRQRLWKCGQPDAAASGIHRRVHGGGAGPEHVCHDPHWIQRVRITRFIVQESAGARAPVMLNKYVTTALVVVLAYLIGATDGWQKIWPIFGATNQLIAAVALFVISTYLIGVRKPTTYTLVPAVFMVVTTIGGHWRGRRTGS